MLRYGAGTTIYHHRLIIIVAIGAVTPQWHTVLPVLAVYAIASLRSRQNTTLMRRRRRHIAHAMALRAGDHYCRLSYWRYCHAWHRWRISIRRHWRISWMSNIGANALVVWRHIRHIAILMLCYGAHANEEYVQHVNTLSAAIYRRCYGSHATLLLRRATVVVMEQRWLLSARMSARLLRDVGGNAIVGVLVGRARDADVGERRQVT